jgi:2-oxoglutarate ferredoxin oxidoreductase subunit delta
MHKVALLRQSCKGVEDCGICIFVCPKKIFAASEEPNDAGYLLPQRKDEDQCTACQNCMVFCPDFAIVVEKDPSKTSAKKKDQDE